MNNKSPEKVFEVAGVKLQKKHYPVLFQSWKRNPEWLREKLEALANAHYEGNVASVAQALESDLEHSQ